MARNIKLLALFNFFLDLKFHSAVLIIYFARVTGSYALAMSLFGIVMLANALFEVPTGIYSDMIGRKKTVLAGALSAIFSAAFYAAGGTYLVLLAGAVLEGLSRAWFSGNNDALLYDSLRALGKKESFAHYQGKTRAMFDAALMIGAVTGSIMAQWSFPLIMWLSVIPQVLCFTVALFFKEPESIQKGKTNVYGHLKSSLALLWRNKLLRLLSLQEILRYGAGESSFNFNTAFIQTVWPIWAIGISRFMTFGGSAVSFWYAGKTIKKIGEYNSIILANVATRLANLVAYGFPSVLSPVIMGTTSITYGASMVSNDALAHAMFTDRERATLSSITSFFGALFYAVFSPLFGLLADMTGPAKALIWVQVFMLGVLGIQLRVKHLAQRSVRL